MKTQEYLKIAAVAACAGVMLNACGSSNKYAAQGGSPVVPQRQNTEVIEDGFPCWEPDTDDKFVGVASAYVSTEEQQERCRQEALTNAQNDIRRKMKHAYQGMVSDFSKNITKNKNATAMSDFEAAGDAIIDVIVGDTKAVCLKRGYPPGGGLNVYIRVEVNKKFLAKEIAENTMGEAEIAGVEVRRDDYRAKVEAKMKAYKESKKPQ